MRIAEAVRPVRPELLTRLEILARAIGTVQMLIERKHDLTGDEQAQVRKLNEWCQEVWAMREALAAQPSAWQPIETAPKGSWLSGPNDVRDPDYVEPPTLWLFLSDGTQCAAFADAYYAEGGNGYDGRGFWVEPISGERVEPTHWMPLPAAPERQP
jgi:hypothetical protein